MAFKAAEDSRRLSLPATPADYKPELPKDFVKPEGIDIQFKADDPTLVAAQAAAKEMGLTQDQFSKFVGLYAADRVNQVQQFKSARDAEIQKLGPTAPARMDALKAFYTARLGEAAAKPIIDSIWTADAVKAHEKVLQVFASQGAGGFSQANREPGDANGKASAEQYAKMSPAERLDYARRHSNGAAAH